jgi:hypothetical protein
VPLATCKHANEAIVVAVRRFVHPAEGKLNIAPFGELGVFSWKRSAQLYLDEILHLGRWM